MTSNVVFSEQLPTFIVEMELLLFFMLFFQSTTFAPPIAASDSDWRQARPVQAKTGEGIRA